MGKLFTIARAHLDHSNIGALFDRAGERQRSRRNCGKDRRTAVEGLIHHITKDRRPEFHRPDFINHNKLPRMHGFAERFDTDGLQRREIEPIFSDALGRFEIHMRQ